MRLGEAVEIVLRIREYGDLDQEDRDALAIVVNECDQAKYQEERY